jgi:hypothetical protein
MNSLLKILSSEAIQTACKYLFCLVLRLIIFIFLYLSPGNMPNNSFECPVSVVIQSNCSLDFVICKYLTACLLAFYQ